MTTTTLSSKYQVVIPKAVRTHMRLRVGETVTLYPLDRDRVVLVKHSANPTEALRGLGKEVWRALGGTEKYIRRERKSWR